jgi:hypothetical protein
MLPTPNLDCHETVITAKSVFQNLWLILTLMLQVCKISVSDQFNTVHCDIAHYLAT